MMMFGPGSYRTSTVTPWPTKVLLNLVQTPIPRPVEVQNPPHGFREFLGSPPHVSPAPGTSFVRVSCTLPHITSTPMSAQPDCHEKCTYVQATCEMRESEYGGSGHGVGSLQSPCSLHLSQTYLVGCTTPRSTGPRSP